MIVITRAITLTQPWATLVAIGAKRIETRSWATSYRGWLGIHASKAFPGSCRTICYYSEPYRRLLLEAGYRTWRDLPVGALVGAVNLVDIRTAPQPGLVAPFSDEWNFGDFADGRKLWLLEDAHRLAEPAPMKGMLSVWTLPRSFELDQFRKAA